MRSIISITVVLQLLILFSVDGKLHRTRGSIMKPTSRAVRVRQAESDALHRRGLLADGNTTEKSTVRNSTKRRMYTTTMHVNATSHATSIDAARSTANVSVLRKSSRCMAGSRVCGECENTSATFGVVAAEVGTRSGSKEWTLVLCRNCALKMENHTRKGMTVMPLAGRCAQCRKFATYGDAPGIRRHCRSPPSFPRQLWIVLRVGIAFLRVFEV